MVIERDARRYTERGDVGSAVASAAVDVAPINFGGSLR
jgi:hypothetical protein